MGAICRTPYITIGYSDSVARIRVDTFRKLVIIAIGGKSGNPLHLDSANFTTGAE
jgi:hypothetical protein